MRCAREDPPVRQDCEFNTTRTRRASEDGPRWRVGFVWQPCHNRRTNRQVDFMIRREEGRQPEKNAMPQTTAKGGTRSSAALVQSASGADYLSFGRRRPKVYSILPLNSSPVSSF